MKLTLHRDGRALRCRVPFPGADFVEVEGEGEACACGQPLRVCCRCAHVGHDTLEGEALARRCGAPVGHLRVEFSTIFGIEEDARVLGGPARVY